MTTLHVTNGGDAGDKLRSFVNGPVALACDVLHEGPCPPVDGDAWHEVRARFLARPGHTAEDLKASLAADERAIADASRRGDEIVLWFEHDLFDQLALIRTLDLMAPLKPHASLICIDRFPGVDRFIGLGQLTREQLATLTGIAASVTRGHYTLAVDAWRAFRSPDPEGLVLIANQLSAARQPLSEGGPPLPFLGDALIRFLAEYPSTTNGLSRTEALALEALIDGPIAAGVLFAATQARETRPFMGDSTFLEIIERLASARVPLVTVEVDTASGDPRRAAVAIADAGREVLAGNADHIRLNGIDVWRGGVHLTGSHDSPWRWDTRLETLVS